MKEYYQRVSDKLLLEHLESKGAVLIEGAKWCGKTTSAKHIAKSVIEMDRPDMTEQYQQMARIKPSNLLEGEVPRLENLVEDGGQAVPVPEPEPLASKDVARGDHG